MCKNISFSIILLHTGGLGTAKYIFFSKIRFPDFGAKFEKIQNFKNVLLFGLDDENWAHR